MSRTSNVGFVYRQYTKEGVFLADFKSSREAGKAARTSSGTVVRAAHGERKSGGGFVWRKVREETPRENIQVEFGASIGYHERRPVVQKDREGNVLNEYISIAHACRELKIGRRSLSCAVSGAQKTAGGYCWALKETAKTTQAGEESEN